MMSKKARFFISYILLAILAIYLLFNNPRSELYVKRFFKESRTLIVSRKYIDKSNHDTRMIYVSNLNTKKEERIVIPRIGNRTIFNDLKINDSILIEKEKYYIRIKGEVLDTTINIEPPLSKLEGVKKFIRNYGEIFKITKRNSKIENSK
ncbi:hypothetical protein ACE1ET_20025 [Saccharicrinis sp. FJH62]|uniref:hypothetical protein n=1 Tax=Saccharicrinis sp. FJH62 TaxID=3344657 RepID=UPI0035D50B7E